MTFRSTTLTQFINAAISYYETTKAADAVAALKKSLKPKATVKRDGKWKVRRNAIQDISFSPLDARAGVTFFQATTLCLLCHDRVKIPDTRSKKYLLRYVRNMICMLVSRIWMPRWLFQETWSCSLQVLPFLRTVGSITVRKTNSCLFKTLPVLFARRKHFHDKSYFMTRT